MVQSLAGSTEGGIVVVTVVRLACICLTPQLARGVGQLLESEDSEG